jgi:16S rRNA G1207 methylase RsmC
MVGEKRSILELGCGEGLGGVILGEQATRYLGVDPSKANIETAKKNLSKDHITYVAGALDGKVYGAFEGVVSLSADSALISMALSNLDERGVCVLGHPKDLQFEEEIKTYFHHVFSFGMNDEVICTGPTDYILYVACFKKG